MINHNTSILLGNCNSNIKPYYLDCNKKKLVIKRLNTAFKKCGVNVAKVKPNDIAKYDELIWMRDIFIPIDNKYIIGNLTNKSTMGTDRSKEHLFVEPYLNPKKTKIYPPMNVKLEGGDIIQYDDFIFVGISNRTNKAGYNFVRKTFKNKTVIPIKHKALHLDCTFCILDTGLIFYDSKYISNINDIMKLPKNFITYDICNIADSGKYLTTNFVQINDNIIISNTPENKSFRDILSGLGYNLEIVNTEDFWREGGSIRCLTQWL